MHSRCDCHRQRPINQSHDLSKVQKVPVLWTGRLDFCIVIRSTVETNDSMMSLLTVVLSVVVKESVVDVILPQSV